MSEIKIEPYYRHQGRQLVDCLFDKGLFSGHLSRDSINDVESFLALYLQFSAQTAELTKKYKATDQPRHEEEMRWIARVREAEARVAELEKLLVREEKANEAWKWGREVGVFLLKALRHKPGHSFDLTEGSRLFTAGIALGIIPEGPRPSPAGSPSGSAFITDHSIFVKVLVGEARSILDFWRRHIGIGSKWGDETLAFKHLEEALDLGNDWEARPGDGCPCPPEETFPGQIILRFCPRCGGRKI